MSYSVTVLFMDGSAAELDNQGRTVRDYVDLYGIGPEPMTESEALTVTEDVMPDLAKGDIIHIEKVDNEPSDTQLYEADKNRNYKVQTNTFGR